MSNITRITNPLMKPVQYNGQTYFTGQYFHQMYRNNSDTNGKYKRPGDFMRLIRSIEAYQKYVEAGDIVEIRSKSDIQGDDTETQNLRLAYKENNYATIMLINATVQVALTHYLDDEVSKNTSVNINRQIAEKSTTPKIGQVRVAKELIDTFLEAGRLLGTDQAMARVVAVDQVRQHTGLDMTPLLSNNAIEEAPVTPTELGKELGISGRKMNAELEGNGFQAKNDEGNWMPTEKGKPFCTVNPYKAPNSNHTGYRILWHKNILDELTKAA